MKTKFHLSRRSLSPAAGFLALAGCLGLSSTGFAQTSFENLVVSVGTTIQDSSANNWSYVLVGSPQPGILAGKKFAIFSKAGHPTDAGTFTQRGTLFQQSDP